MKILVTGAMGQLGHDVVAELKKRNVACLGVDMADFDITDYTAAASFVSAYMPDAVIHCSAYTAVDNAEADEKAAFSVNADATRHLAQLCNSIGAKMLYVSTDYVFDGTGCAPYETDHQTHPLSVYGKSKLLGEQYVKECLEKHFIVRTSWVFGAHGKNFVKTMLRLGKERKELSVVADQIGSPTYTIDLAVLFCDMIMTDKYGTYHATNEGFCSWAEFTEKIFESAGYKTPVRHILSAEYQTNAERPLNSRLSKACLDRANFSRLPDWQDGLKRFLAELEA